MVQKSCNRATQISSLPRAVEVEGLTILKYRVIFFRNGPDPGFGLSLKYGIESYEGIAAESVKRKN